MSINSQSLDGLTHGDVVNILKNAYGTIVLQVNVALNNTVCSLNVSNFQMLILRVICSGSVNDVDHSNS